MRSKVLATAICALVLTAGMAEAQSLVRLGGPANLPPTSFTGQQFVDNRGCLFLRAGFGANVNWVPRVDRSYKPLCGLPPTFGAAVIAAVAQSMAPDPEAGAVAALAEPAAAAAAQTRPVAPAVAQPANAPPPARQRKSLMELLFGSPKPAMAANPAPVVVATSPAPQPGNPDPSATSNAVPAPPAGYEAAWKDDRLNPRRGLGTATGQAQQDQVWTRDVPAVLVTEAKAKAMPPKVTLATKSAPPTQTAAQNAAQNAAQPGAVFVQIGTFGQVGNAARVKDRLGALGLPVATSTITRQGKVLQVIYAGPFTSLAQARTALQQVHRAGFGDAVLR